MSNCVYPANMGDVARWSASDGWSDASKFLSKNKTVDHKGKNFKLLFKKERKLSNMKRVGNMLLFVVAIVCSLGMAVLYKPARKLCANKI